MAIQVGNRLRTQFRHTFEFDVGKWEVQQDQLIVPRDSTLLLLAWEGTVLRGDPSKQDMAHIELRLIDEGRDLTLAATSADMISPLDSVMAGRVERLESALANLTAVSSEALALSRLPATEKEGERFSKLKTTIDAMRRLGWNGPVSIDHRALGVWSKGKRLGVIFEQGAVLRLVVERQAPVEPFRLRITVTGTMTRDTY